MKMIHSLVKFFTIVFMSFSLVAPTAPTFAQDTILYDSTGEPYPTRTRPGEDGSIIHEWFNPDTGEYELAYVEYPEPADSPINEPLPPYEEWPLIETPEPGVAVIGAGDGPIMGQGGNLQSAEVLAGLINENGGNLVDALTDFVNGGEYINYDDTLPLVGEIGGILMGRNPFEDPIINGSLENMEDLSGLDIIIITGSDFPEAADTLVTALEADEGNQVTVMPPTATGAEIVAAIQQAAEDAEVTNTGVVVINAGAHGGFDPEGTFTIGLNDGAQQVSGESITNVLEELGVAGANVQLTCFSNACAVVSIEPAACGDTVLNGLEDCTNERIEEDWSLLGPYDYE